jgi:hypothetical protein
MSLPTVLKKRICEYGEATEVLALASTCSTIRNELNLSFLRRPYTILRSHPFVSYSLSPYEVLIRFGVPIPIFFPSHCHSVRLICLWRDAAIWRYPARIFIVSQPKDGRVLENDTDTIVSYTGEKGTIVWQSYRGGPKFVSLSFRFDCSLKYSLWFQCGGGGSAVIVRILKTIPLIWDDEFRTRMKSYDKCISFDRAMAWGDLIKVELPYEVSDGIRYAPMTYSLRDVPLFAQLVAHSLDLLNCALQESSSSCGDPLSPGRRPIVSFFESSESGIGATTSHGVMMGLKMLADIYLQLAAGKESHCNDIKILGGRDFAAQGRPRLVTLPKIHLGCKVGWDEDLSDNGCNGTAESNSHTCRPCVAARIPMVSGTESFRLTGRWERWSQAVDGDVNATVFTVLTPHAAEEGSKCDSLVYRGRPVGSGYHQALVYSGSPVRSWYNEAIRGSECLSFEQTFVVDPEAVAYYLCYFPREHSKEELCAVCVDLTVSLPEVRASSEELFDPLLDPFFERTTFGSSFHLGLLRAMASELHLGSASTSDDRYAAVIGSLSKLLSDKGFATEKVGLECLVEVIDTILVQRRLPRKPM